ncbi:uncharacterized protein LOC130992851 [Salvia miltiorrhiza]|uniref:uncharacterized protein LOC130992851 n=1 Tax=Salvia miltiorrhiza TaxID=226208 RepID=UPI0025AC29C7|nr:uncharacterized protein LOC130992851 [Salvia miltiorrhiza]XP_057773592.1 uncharacterized protein LOC130992851 [Salvia miltiorrhiza]
MWIHIGYSQSLNHTKATFICWTLFYHRNRDIPWKAAVDNAMSIFNAHNGKKIKNSAKWDIIKGPKQPGSTECGFFVMRYMKDIVEGFERDDNISLPSLFTNVAYSQVEIDEVREEWAKCVLLHVLD